MSIQASTAVWKWSYTGDSTGKKTVLMTSPAGAVTSYQFNNGNGSLEVVHWPTGVISTYSYNSNEQVEVTVRRA